MNSAFLEVTSTHYYLLLVYMEHVKSSKKNGSLLPEDSDYSIVNLFPHALFSQVDLEIDGVNLSSHDNLYPYKAYLETLLSYGSDAKSSYPSTSHFAKDTPLTLKMDLKEIKGMSAEEKR